MMAMAASSTTPTTTPTAMPMVEPLVLLALSFCTEPDCGAGFSVAAGPCTVCTEGARVLTMVWWFWTTVVGRATRVRAEVIVASSVTCCTTVSCGTGEDEGMIEGGAMMELGSIDGMTDDWVSSELDPPLLTVPTSSSTPVRKTVYALGPPPVLESVKSPRVSNDEEMLTHFLVKASAWITAVRAASFVA